VSLAADGIAVAQLGREPGFRPRLANAIARVAAETGASVAHCHQYSPFVYAALARVRRPRLRVIFTEHGRLNDAAPSPKRQFVNPLLAHAADRIFSVSQDLRRHMIREGLPASRIEVIPNGVDPGPERNPARDELRQALGAGPETIVVMTVARLDPVKDLETLLGAISELARLRSAVQLVIVGDGPARGRLETDVASRQLGSIVRFLGSQDEARRWLAAADIYVNSSISEGISLTILEAMAASLPVVATAVGGTPEVVDSSCGVLVPARDSASLGAALVELASSPSKRTALGRTGRQRVLSTFTIDRMVATYEQVYEETA
jgi:glycosyltransferase involved in cell wall biosynthesis